ncbi:hypothetical protein M8C21_027293 [Ambrosia artemisiifolia]|uniref:Uncharacterized protein n=1 Tax=Ambrosia artemisiifolia TaxID=4212 RepID=A0AAD5BMT7_AMBAR|nr:hypothetical protein M8C21_027293 [Ambrosia artemisiifolia]
MAEKKSIRWGIDIIRGSFYANITSENLQPQPSPQSQLQPLIQQQQQTLWPQLQPLPPPPPSPPTELPLQMESQTPPHPSQIPQSHGEEQICLQKNLQPPPPTSRPQLQPLPPPPPPPPPKEMLPQPESQAQAQPSNVQQPHDEEQICFFQSQYRLPGSEPLPKGLVATTSDLQMQPLWGPRKKINSTTSLFTAAVGIEQKETVDKMVRKFLSSDFTVMLFHYDGVVDEWKDLEWANSVIHVSAVKQTKWWFAKRFLHPDIVAEYSYIFVWDEDLGVDNFDPDRYLTIVKDEGLEISQPALDAEQSESDLNHAWGLDIQFGYCAQGDRTKNVGVVDAEYIVHYGLPTFGELQNKERIDASEPNARVEVRRRSHQEYKIFKRRWQEAAKDDEYWVDPYPDSWNHSII